jgi:hypothetical protein
MWYSSTRASTTVSPDMQGMWGGLENATPRQRPPRFLSTLVIDRGAWPAKLPGILSFARFEDISSTPNCAHRVFRRSMNIERVRGSCAAPIIFRSDTARRDLIPRQRSLRSSRSFALRTGVLSAMDGPEQRPRARNDVSCLARRQPPPILAIRNGVNLHQIVADSGSFVLRVSGKFVGAARAHSASTAPTALRRR